MLSAAKLAANRRNARKSTGPRTPQGKAAVRFNALKHGLTARHAPLPAADLAEFSALLCDWRSDLRPSGVAEDGLVLQIAAAAWHMRRLERLETRLCNRSSAADPKLFAALDRLSRQQARHQRSFYRALHALERLRKEKMTKQTHRLVGRASSPAAGLLAGLPVGARRPPPQCFKKNDKTNPPPLPSLPARPASETHNRLAAKRYNPFLPFKEIAMRRFGALAVFAVLLFAAFESAVSQGSAVRELAPGVFFRQGDRDRQQPANCGWILFKDYVFVIDANFPWGAREILPEIKKTTSKPIRFVFDTHYHGDHAYGNALFVDAGAAIVCSEDCAGESRAKGQAGWDKNTATGEFSLKPYRLEHPTIVFGDGMVFDDGQHRVELKKMGPGHTKGDSVAYLPSEKILFTGDLCVNWKNGNNVADRDADIPNWVRALGEMARWDVKIVAPGHGALGTTETMRGDAAYLDDMWKQVVAGRRAGKSADEMVKQIDLSKHVPYGGDPDRNAGSIRAMYQKAGP